MTTYQRKKGLITRISKESLQTGSLARLLRGSILTYYKTSFPDLCVLDAIIRLAAPGSVQELTNKLITCDDQSIEGARNMLLLLRLWRNTFLNREVELLFAISIDLLIDIQTDKLLAATAAQGSAVTAHRLKSTEILAAQLRIVFQDALDMLAESQNLPLSDADIDRLNQILIGITVALTMSKPATKPSSGDPLPSNAA